MLKINKQLLLLSILPILLFSRISIASGGGAYLSELINTSLSYSNVYSETNSGSNIEVTAYFAVYGISFSETKLQQESINNAFIGLNYPLFSDYSLDNRASFVFLNIGQGQKNRVFKAGVKMSLTRLFDTDIPFNIIISRESYINNHHYDNTQIGILISSF